MQVLTLLTRRRGQSRLLPGFQLHLNRRNVGVMLDSVNSKYDPCNMAFRAGRKDVLDTLVPLQNVYDAESLVNVNST